MPDNATPSLIEFTRQLSSLEIKNVDSSVLQNFSLNVPYAILLETYRESSDFYQFYELTPSGYASIHFNEDAQNLIKKRSNHKHSFVEIMYVLSGKVTMQIEHHLSAYTQGQCCVLNRNICHSELLKDEFSVVFFMLSDDFLEDISENYQSELKDSLCQKLSVDIAPIFQLIHDNQANTRFFEKVFLTFTPVFSIEKTIEEITIIFNQIIFEIQKKQTGYTFYIKGAFSRFFQLLSSTEMYTIEKTLAKTGQHDKLFTEITHIMEENHGHCTRNELSERLHYTGEYINKIIKMYTGKTLSEYSQSIIMLEADKLLLNTDMNVSDIINKLGIANRSYFYRLFEKTFGVTPLEYRKQKRKE